MYFCHFKSRLKYIWNKRSQNRINTVLSNVLLSHIPASATGCLWGKRQEMQEGAPGGRLSVGHTCVPHLLLRHFFHAQQSHRVQWSLGNSVMKLKSGNEKIDQSLSWSLGDVNRCRKIWASYSSSDTLDSTVTPLMQNNAPKLNLNLGPFKTGIFPKCWTFSKIQALNWSTQTWVAWKTSSILKQHK